MTQSQRDNRSTMSNRKDLFNNFVDYWYYAKNLTKSQRDIVFDSLSASQKRKIQQSYNRGGWEDRFMRDEIDELIDDIKDRYGYDLLDMRMKALRGKSVYIPRDFWDFVTIEFEKFDERHKHIVFGGIKGTVCKENTNVVLLLPFNQEE